MAARAAVLALPVSKVLTAAAHLPFFPCQLLLILVTNCNQNPEIWQQIERAVSRGLNFLSACPSADTVTLAAVEISPTGQIHRWIICLMG